jgi:poly(3-hydroxybutyrate) depolymerase
VTTQTPHLNARLASLVTLLVAAALAATSVTTASGIAPALEIDTPPAAASPRVAATPRPSPARVRGPFSRLWAIDYTAHNGARRPAVVIAPARYGPRNETPPLPLVISPHGRAGTGLSNARYWGDLPGRAGFVVVNPDGMGRRLKYFSYGYRGQIDDLARMPEIVSKALPWIHVDPTRVYALGSSMGGQETLLLVARHPEILAGAAAMDSVTDLSRRYGQLPSVPSDPDFVKEYGEARGVNLQRVMRREVGGTPDEAPRAYASRSALSLAPAIAASGVPLQIWWSTRDKIVSDQAHQSEALFRVLRRLDPSAPVSAYRGRWAHSSEMRATSLLPLALADFGLLPDSVRRIPATVRHYPAPAVQA